MFIRFLHLNLLQFTKCIWVCICNYVYSVLMIPEGFKSVQHIKLNYMYLLVFYPHSSSLKRATGKFSSQPRTDFIKHWCLVIWSDFGKSFWQNTFCNHYSFIFSYSYFLYFLLFCHFSFLLLSFLRYPF